MTAEEQDLLRLRLLGWGPACEEILPGADLGRDIRLEKGANGLDLALVTRMDNLGQSLAIALTTGLGADLFNARFGFDGLNALADESDPVLQRERIRIGVIKLLKNDVRVRKIVDVNFSGEGRLEPPPPGSRELEVRVVFEAVTGESAAVDLGKVRANV
jgi:hypothetical protein